MKSVFTILIVLALSAALIEPAVANPVVWKCIARADIGVHTGLAVWGDAQATQAEAQMAALKKCRRQASTPGLCKVRANSDCWKSYRH